MTSELSTTIKGADSRVDSGGAHGLKRLLSMIKGARASVKVEGAPAAGCATAPGAAAATTAAAAGFSMAPHRSAELRTSLVPEGRAGDSAPEDRGGSAHGASLDGGERSR